MNETSSNENTALAPAETSSTPQRFTEPTWQARRHDHGSEIDIALPGVRKEDVKLEARGHRLILEARRATSDELGTLVHGEPAPEGYRLELRLGRALDGAGLSAKLEHGLLKVAVPLVEAARPKSIPIE
jgi:HSP20 family protein